jgi:hypothetical protein
MNVALTGCATTLRAIQRAESIASAVLGGERFAELRREGAHLGSDEVDGIAFAVEDVS